MKNILSKLSIAALGATMLTAPLMAGEGDWLVRLRGIHVNPTASADITPIGGTAEISSTTVPELDISYFFTDKLAVELILATTKHSPTALGTAVGDVALGSVYLLPPTLTLQYHPLAGEKFSPYFGAGVNYTIFYKEKEPAAVITDIDYGNKFGLAAQVGADIWMNDEWFFNMDLKKVWLKTDVSMNAGTINADVKINPWIFGVGFGRKF